MQTSRTADDLPGSRRPGLAEEAFTLTVEGETFTVTPRTDGGCSYAWETGPNEYGFTSGPIRIAGDPAAVVEQTPASID
ncbi:MAG: hypothetical protein WA988_04635 [Candidatus Nanopelagicales bacterium]|jgi:hypothetical protein